MGFIADGWRESEGRTLHRRVGLQLPVAFEVKQDKTWNRAMERENLEAD